MKILWVCVPVTCGFSSCRSIAQPTRGGAKCNGVCLQHVVGLVKFSIPEASGRLEPFLEEKEYAGEINY